MSQVDNTQHLQHIHMGDDLPGYRRSEVQQEAEIALRDIISCNSRFVPYDDETGAAFTGPFSVALSPQSDHLSLVVQTAETKVHLAEYTLSIKPFRSLIRDYFIVCDSYFDAIRMGDTHRVEAIDMGRRGIHNEASELLRDLMEGKISMDIDTARRLFTLITVFYARLGSHSHG